MLNFKFYTKIVSLKLDLTTYENNDVLELEISRVLLLLQHSYSFFLVIVYFFGDQVS